MGALLNDLATARWKWWIFLGQFGVTLNFLFLLKVTLTWFEWA